MTIPQFEAQHVLASQATLAEGPIRDPRDAAYWRIDIIEKKLFRFDPDSKQNSQWQ